MPTTRHYEYVAIEVHLRNIPPGEQTEQDFWSELVASYQGIPVLLSFAYLKIGNRSEYDAWYNPFHRQNESVTAMFQPFLPALFAFAGPRIEQARAQEESAVSLLTRWVIEHQTSPAGATVSTRWLFDGLVDLPRAVEPPQRRGKKL